MPPLGGVLGSDSTLGSLGELSTHARREVNDGRGGASPEEGRRIRRASRPGDAAPALGGAPSCHPKEVDVE